MPKTGNNRVSRFRSRTSMTPVNCSSWGGFSTVASMAAWSEQGHGGGAGQALALQGDVQNGDGTTSCPNSGGAMDGGGRRVQIHIVESRLRCSGELGKHWDGGRRPQGREGLGGADGGQGIRRFGVIGFGRAAMTARKESSVAGVVSICVGLKILRGLVFRGWAKNCIPVGTYSAHRTIGHIPGVQGSTDSPILFSTG